MYLTGQARHHHSSVPAAGRR